MSLFQSLGQGRQQPQNPTQMLQQLKSDPAEFLKQQGFNIPQGVDMRNPQAIINSLMQSGQIPINRYQQTLQRMQGPRRR